MIKSTFLAKLSLCLFLATAFSASAHHSVSGQFIADDDLLYRVTGVVQDIRWIQPHIYFYVDVEEEDGSITTHELETFPPVFFRRFGFNRSTFETGETMSFDAWPARDGTKALGWIKVIHFGDGRSLAMHTAEEAQTAR